jgi:hypothetical protein
MRTIGLALVILALTVGFGIPALAGGKGAVATGLYLAHYPNTAPPSVIQEPPVRVGNVVFNPVRGGKMDVQITLRKGHPDTAFEVFLVPLAEWGFQGQSTWKSMNTDKHGHSTLRFQFDIPDTSVSPLEGKVIVRTPRNPDQTVDHVYVTELLPLNLDKGK